MAPKRKKYGPNSEQVEDYLGRIAALEADDWASLALTLKDSATLPDAGEKAIDTAKSRARKRGLLSEVDAAGRKARHVTDTILDANTGLRYVLDRALTRAAATSGATLLVLRPFLDEGEFIEAWPMRIIDPRSLPDHAYRLISPAPL